MNRHPDPNTTYAHLPYLINDRIRIKKGAVIVGSTDKKCWAHPNRNSITGCIFPKLTQDHIVVLHYYTGLDDRSFSVNWEEYDETGLWQNYCVSIKNVEKTQEMIKEQVHVHDIVDYLLSEEEIDDVS